MRSGTKSDLATILESSVTNPDVRPHVEVILFDDAVAVNLFKPGACKHFKNMEIVFLKYITSQLQEVSKRLEYIHDSFKSMREANEGKVCEDVFNLKSGFPETGVPSLGLTKIRQSCSGSLLNCVHV